jgi:ribA/ribD-fused uncharacterized protein
MIINGEKRDYIVHNKKEVKGFFGDYRFLSNFHECPVMFDGVIYPSSENAYMAAKTLDVEARKAFETMNPKEAKLAGRMIPLREDWELVKIDIMRFILFDKFTRNLDIREKLIQTEDAYLEETNHWGDTIWGVCDGFGSNLLGKILMDTRAYWKNSFNNSKLF